MNATFDLQRTASRSQTAPTAAERRTHLGAISRILLEDSDAIVAAVNADFGHRSSHETRLLELFPSLQEANHARKHVAKWMRPERRPSSLWFRPGRSRIVKQPLGVVGVVVPWNYPVYLSLVPLVAALAAGNRVMIKMSEYTPRTGELLSRLLAAHFGPDRVAVINGDVAVAQAFVALPFDHILFTGSTAVGRHVMRAASANLTPVTLELGGKSPAIIAPDFPIDVAARRIMLGKCFNAGQTCVATDYVLLPAEKIQPFIDHAREAVRQFYAEGVGTEDYTSIISDQHYARLVEWRNDAQAKGAHVETLVAGDSAVTRKFAPAIVTGVTSDMRVMQEEIFGPLLPLVPYQTLDEAIAFVESRPRPLAMYYFDHDAGRVARVLRDAVAGGVTVNDTVVHLAQEELPFGGVGPSGMGDYHGVYGFNAFSNRKGVFLQSRINAMRLLAPPFGARTEKLLRLLLR